MPLVPRRGLLAIASVVEIAVGATSRPLSAKVLAERYRLAPRHLEPILQALVLKGIRGPHGGYELGRERRSITADDILRAAITAKDSDALVYGGALVNEIIRPVLAETERMVSGALGRINIDDMVRRVAVPK